MSQNCGIMAQFEVNISQNIPPLRYLPKTENPPYIQQLRVGKFAFMNAFELTFDKAASLDGYRRFEQCTFKNCDLGYASLSGMLFTDCAFENCNLSLAKIEKTGFQDVSFKGCKMSGLNFSHGNDFGLKMGFENCQLDDTVFFKKKLKNTTFRQCSLKNADFTECDLTAAVFDNCDLELAVFERTILKDADLRTAYNFTIDPEKNALYGARFSLYGLQGLLVKYGVAVE